MVTEQPIARLNVSLYFHRFHQGCGALWVGRSSGHPSNCTVNPWMSGTGGASGSPSRSYAISMCAGPTLAAMFSFIHKTCSLRGWALGNAISAADCNDYVIQGTLRRGLTFATRFRTPGSPGRRRGFGRRDEHLCAPDSGVTAGSVDDRVKPYSAPRVHNQVYRLANEDCAGLHHRSIDARVVLVQSHDCLQRSR